MGDKENGLVGEIVGSIESKIARKQLDRQARKLMGG